MRRRLSAPIALVLLTSAGLACGRNSPAPVPNAPTPTPVTPSPTPSPSPRPSTPAFVGWSYGNPNKLEATLGVVYHMQAWADFSDHTTRDVADEAIWQSSNAVVATVSAPPGVLMTAAQEGDADVHATYQGFDLVYAVSVRRRTYGPPYPDEIAGNLYEIAPTGNVGLRFAQVAIAGGEYDGRSVRADSDGKFRFSGIFSAGFDLVTSSPGYRTTKYRIASLPRNASPSIALEVEPWLVSEVLEGPCIDSAHPHTTFFTPRQGDGIFKVTQVSAFGGYTEGVSVKLLANGVTLKEIVFVTEVFVLHAGTTYEVRLGCEYGTGSATSRVNYIRPR